MTNIQTVIELATTYETDDMNATSAAKLRGLRSLRNDVDAAIFEGVRSARSLGESWESIGNALGISRQAAQKRWGPLIAH